MGWSASKSLARLNVHIGEIGKRVLLTGEDEYIQMPGMSADQVAAKTRAIFKSFQYFPGLHEGRYTSLSEQLTVHAGEEEMLLGAARISRGKGKGRAKAITHINEYHAIELLKRKGAGQTIIPPFTPSADFTIERLTELLAAHTSYHMTGTPVTAPDGRLIVNIKEREPDPSLIAELEEAQREFEQRPSVFDRFFGRSDGPVINEERLARRIADMAAEEE